MKIHIEMDIEFAKRLLLLSAKADPTGIYDGQNRESMAMQILAQEKEQGVQGRDGGPNS